MNTITLETLDLLRISYLATKNTESLIQIQSNKNKIKITFDKFLKSESRLSFELDIKRHTNIAIIIKASDLINTTNKFFDMNEYEHDLECEIMENYDHNFDHNFDFDTLKKHTEICFDNNKMIINYDNNEYTIDSMFVDFEKEYDLEKEENKESNRDLEDILSYMQILLFIGNIGNIEYQGLGWVAPILIYNHIVYRKPLLYWYYDLRIYDTERAYINLLLDIEPYYNISAAAPYGLDKAELKDLEKKHLFRIELEIDADGDIDSFRLSEPGYKTIEHGYTDQGEYISEMSEYEL